MKINSAKFTPTFDKEPKIFNRINIKLVFFPHILMRKIFNRIKNVKKRDKIFRDFFDNYLSSAKLTDKIINEYDFFVAGSDQIWNNPKDSIYFLDFCDVYKRIVYAASFGVSSIPDEKKIFYYEKLKDIPYISVREFSGAKIIKDLLNRDVPVLIDPTLMLDREEWLKISRPSSAKPKEKYLLCYFLGKEAKKLRKEGKVFAKKEKLKMVDLFNAEIPKYYTNGPAEFIDFIKDAEIVFTNSYHGAIFSIIFEKPFVLAGREGMNSRIETLTTIFNLKDRIWDNVKTNKNYFSCDFKHIKPILETERKKAYTYLEKALRINED